MFITKYFHTHVEEYFNSYVASVIQLLVIIFLFLYVYIDVVVIIVFSGVAIAFQRSKKHELSSRKNLASIASAVLKQMVVCVRRVFRYICLFLYLQLIQCFIFTTIYFCNILTCLRF